MGKYVGKSVFLRGNIRLAVACRPSFHMPLQVAKHSSGRQSATALQQHYYRLLISNINLHGCIFFFFFFSVLCKILRVPSAVKHWLKVCLHIRKSNFLLKYKRSSLTSSWLILYWCFLAPCVLYGIAVYGHAGQHTSFVCDYYALGTNPYCDW